MNYYIVKTTYPSLKEARKSAKMIIENKLAACTQISKVESCYNFESKISLEKEYLLEAKIVKENYSKIEDFIVKNHSYKCPQIIAIPVEYGFLEYLKWIDNSLR